MCAVRRLSSSSASARVASKRRLLVEPTFVERGTRLHQTPHLLLEPLPDGIGRARGQALDRRHQPFDRRQLIQHDGLQAPPLLGARAHHAVERLAEVREHGFCARQRFGVVLFRLDEFENALDAEQGFRARRADRHGLPQPLECLQDLLQRGLVELDLRLPVRAPDAQVDGEAAARNALAHEFHGCAAPDPRSRGARAA